MRERPGIRGQGALRGKSEFVRWEDGECGGFAEEGFHAGDAIVVEDVMDVGGEVGADGGLGDGEAGGPLVDEGVKVGEAVVAGLDEVVGDRLPCLRSETWGTRRVFGSTPDGGDERQACESGPFFGEVVVVELFAGAGESVGTFFEGEECWVADKDGGVGLVEHAVEVGGVGEKRDPRVTPAVEENAGVGEGGARGDVGGDGAEGG